MMESTNARLLLGLFVLRQKIEMNSGLTCGHLRKTLRNSRHLAWPRGRKLNMGMWGAKSRRIEQNFKENLPIQHIAIQYDTIRY